MLHSKYPLITLALSLAFMGLYAQGDRTQAAPVLRLTIDLRQTAQVIDNIGASGCWYSEPIGRYWPAIKKERMARWLFSRDVDAGGNPEGIGLSAWRFNIGGGTAEQGDSSGIPNVWRRVECFLGPDGRFDWNKQAGYVWFLKQAHAYGVERLIAFSNTPPVFFTQNGLGYKTEKDLRSNLREDRYGAYAGFLADVLAHFSAEGLKFSYVSPVNEPQWAWADKPGSAGQEGSAWRNEEIRRVVGALDSGLTSRALETKILVTEAGQLNYLYEGSGATSRQVQTLFGEGDTSLLRYSHVGRFIGGHSYFTEGTDSGLVNIRRRVADTTAKYGIDYWETEYSMLANGWREGTKGGRSAMDCALFLAKVIHNDLAVGHAAAWEFWNAYEPGRADSNTRYYLIALKPNKDFTDGGYFATKGLWALGNFSRWIRPGMRRVVVGRSDGKDELAAAQDVMVSAYTDGAQRLVVVAINYTYNGRRIGWDLHAEKVRRYVTSAKAGDDLKFYPGDGEGRLAPRSVTTFVIDLPAQAVKASVVSRPPREYSKGFGGLDNRPPLEPLRLIKLPIGSIRPSGWVLKYLQLQRDGLTGQLGTISAWLDKKDNAWYSGNGKGSHGWEEVPYWLKGYGDLGYILRDTAIIHETRRWLDKVFESQTPDGYFGPRIVENEHQDNKGQTPDLWPNMLMLWCMQSYYEYSGDTRVIPFMTKYFKWEMTVPDDQLLKLYWENSRGGDNLYSIYWLYNHIGEKWLLELARKIHRNTANWEQKGALPNWHNVNIAQCFREPATHFMQSGDSAELSATYNDFFLVRNLYGQVPGGMFGADENARAGYADPRQAVETCGMVEQMASDEILAGITGDPMWADNCEDVAFNTYPAAVMPDFRALRYLTAPNMVVSDSANHSPGIQNEGPFLMMNPFSSRCCQHNHSQGWPYYAEHLWMGTADDGIAAVLYSSSIVDFKKVKLHETTEYPFDGKVKIEIDAEAEFPLYLRLPGWCVGAAVRVNGEAVEETATTGDSYIRLERAWRKGDVVELTLPMQLKARVWPANKNSVSVNYGPLTFSLKIAEDYHLVDSRRAAMWDSHWQVGADPGKWPAYEIFPASLWNYGLVIDKRPLADQFEVVRRPWPASNYPFSADSVPLLIRAKGKVIPEWMVDKYGLCGVLPQSPIEEGTPEQAIELIPMGAARLRISAFPVVE